MDNDVREFALEYLGNNISLLSANQANEKAEFVFTWYPFGGKVPNWTRLHTVASSGLFDIAQNLLVDGVDVNAKGKWGKTPLHLAAAKGHTQVVRLLLQAGAEVAPQESLEGTPLHIAASNGHQSVVEVLIDAGADCNDRRSSLGESPLHLAAENSHIHVARCLIEKGADVNQKDAVVSGRERRPAKKPSPELGEETVSEELG